MDEIHGIHDWISTVVDTAILSGIFITSVLAVFKAGRWFGGIVSSVDKLTTAMTSFEAAFDRHVKDEDARFVSIEQALKLQSKKIETMHTSLAKIERNTNGKTSQ